MVILNRKQSLNRRVCSQSIDGNRAVAAAAAAGAGSPANKNVNYTAVCFCHFSLFLYRSSRRTQVFSIHFCSYFISHFSFTANLFANTCISYSTYTLKLLMPLLLFYFILVGVVSHSFFFLSLSECCFFLSILSRLSKQTFPFCCVCVCVRYFFNFFRQLTRIQ